MRKKTYLTATTQLERTLTLAMEKLGDRKGFYLKTRTDDEQYGHLRLGVTTRPSFHLNRLV
jgi:hypothetical protein